MFSYHRANKSVPYIIPMFGHSYFHQEKNKTAKGKTMRVDMTDNEFTTGFRQFSQSIEHRYAHNNVANFPCVPELIIFAASHLSFSLNEVTWTAP